MNEHQDVIEKLAAVPEDVASIVLGLDEETLRRRPSEGEWSMKEVCGHLVVDARIWQGRFVLMTTQDEPYLERFDPVETANLGNYQEMPIEDIVGEFRRIRRETTDLLEGLDEEGWQRKGLHWSRGELTIAEACSLAANHGAEHVQQLRDLLR
jgi:uncharacterized damage-inducible protein DinB